MNFRRFIITALMLFSALPVLAQSQNRTAVCKEIDSLRDQIKARENLLLEPAAEDRIAYAEFLQQPETGLIRLLPREKYDGKLALRGGGAYYSFARTTTARSNTRASKATNFCPRFSPPCSNATSLIWKNSLPSSKEFTV